MNDTPLKIPRIIHQIFFKGQLPLRLEQQVAELRARNSRWSHVLYDGAKAEHFIFSNYGHEIMECYHSINPEYGAARADLLRHLIIFKVGGVYLDIKSDLKLPLDQILRTDDQYILTQWPHRLGEVCEGLGLHHDLSHVPGGEYQSHHIIAVPGHPFSKAVIDRIVANINNYRPWSGVGRTGVLRTTGPIAYTLAVSQMLATAPHRFATEQEIGATLSIANYDHSGVFPRHYSKLKSPIARLSSAGRITQSIIEWLRKIKQRLKNS